MVAFWVVEPCSLADYGLQFSLLRIGLLCKMFVLLRKQAERTLHERSI